MIEIIKGIEGNAGIRLPASCPVLTMFSKAFFLKVIKSRECVVKGQPKQQFFGLVQTQTVCG